MKKMLTHLGSIALFTLVSQWATGETMEELDQQNQELEILQEDVVEKERQLEESEETLRAQSETLRCLSRLLEAYNACENQHTLRTEEHRACISTAKQTHPGCAS